MKGINQFINLGWTAAAFSVIIFYWYHDWDTTAVIVFLCTSILTVFIPLRLLRLSSSRRFYECAGVRKAGRFVQDGTIVNRIKRSSNPVYSKLTTRNTAKLIFTSVSYERFHLMCFTFFLLTIIHALCNRHFVTAILVAISNIIYNVYPIMLQQYYRMRLQNIVRS